MASVYRRPSQVSNVLLLIALACASGWSTSRAAVLEAGTRQLLQGSSDSSTPFGDLAPGTLAVTFSAVPSKHAPTAIPFGTAESPHPPPYQYDWFSLYYAFSGNVSLVFYQTDAYVVGPGNQKTELPSFGSCDLVTTEYSDLSSLENSCRGNFTLPANLPAVSAVYMSLQAPAGLEFQVPTPLDFFACSAILFASGPPGYTGGTYNIGTFEAAFDNGDRIPLNGNENVLRASTTISLQLNSTAFTGTGALSFQSINMRAQYVTPVQLPEGLSLFWYIPYSFCFFASKEVTVQRASTGGPSPTTSAPSNTPASTPAAPSPTSPPSATPTSTPGGPPPTSAPSAAPTSAPGGGTPTSSGSTNPCDPNSNLPNQCFNANGSASVCCPGQCPDVPLDTPTCGPGGPRSTAPCDPTSSLPNQCFNSYGNQSVCCPGNCPASPGPVASCG